MLLAAYGFVIILMIIVWGIYLATDLPNIVDLAWVIGIAGSGLILITQAQWLYVVLCGALLVLWAARLGSFLWWTRLRHRERDTRYDTMSSHWKMPKALGFFVNYQFQAVLAFIISVPFYFIAARQQPLSLWDLIAAVIVLIGISGEAIADWQLYHFKKCDKGLVCDQGLWRYSMHPNYFFEWLTWLGFSLFALPVAWGGLALMSPLLLYGIMNYITGPMTDKQQLAKKGEVFANYQQSTSKFFFWWRSS